MVEIGISPIAHHKASDMLRATIRCLTQHLDGKEKFGVAPRTQLEARVQQTLEKIKVWKRYPRDTED